MIKYLFIAFCFVSHVLSSTTVDRQEHCIRRNFPNYFALLSEEEALNLIDQAIASVLHQLKVPHIENGVVVNDGFFEKINRIVHDSSPGAKVYISGGMVRSILGYIYKKFYNEEQRSGPMTRTRVLEVFDRIIRGLKRKDILDDLPFFPEKELIPLDALGIGSDYDLLIDFNGSTTNAKDTKEAVVTFINSVETRFGLKNDSSDIKRAVVPIADIKDYHEQITRTTAQGGSSLDWLAYPLDGGSMRMPEKNTNIMHNFYEGNLEYTKPAEVTDNASDKQTMRGLRALLEIPFLVFDEKSENVIIEEMKKISSLSSDAQTQLKKMTRNARFGSAHNRFETSCMPDDKLIQAIKGMMGDKRLIPEFLDDKRVGQYKHEIDDVLMPMNDFIEKYTVNGTLYHGTKDLANLLYMMRNGFYVSKNETDKKNSQGNALFGNGVYATKDYGAAEGFAERSGIVIPLSVRQDQPLRIVDMSDARVNKWLNENNITNKETLAKEYGVDIVVNTHVILQNAKAVKIHKNISQLIQGIQDDILKKIENGASFDLQSILTVLSPYGGYTLLAKVMNPSYKGVDRGIFLKFLGDRLTKDGFNNVQAILDNFDYLAPLIDFSVNKDDVEIGVEFCLKNDRPGKEFFDMFDSYKTAVEFIKKYPKMKESPADTLIQLYQAGVVEKKLLSYEIDFIPTTLDPDVVKGLIELYQSGVINKNSLSDLLYIPKRLTTKVVKGLIELYQSGVIVQFLLSDLKHIPVTLNPDAVEEIIKLYKAGVINKISLSDLRYIPATLNPVAVAALLKLYEAGVMDETLSISDLGDILKTLNPVAVAALLKLYEAGVMDETLSISDLGDILKTLNSDAVAALLELYEAGVMNETLSMLYFEFKFFPETLKPDAAKGIIKLYEAGVMKEKPSIFELRDIPETLNPDAADELLKLYEAGVMDKKLSISEFFYIPEILTSDVVEGIIKLYGAGVMQEQLSLFYFKYILKTLNPDAVAALLKLYETGVMKEKLLESELPKELNQQVVDEMIEHTHALKNQNTSKILVLLSIFSKITPTQQKQLWKEYEEQKPENLVQFMTDGVKRIFQE